VERRWGTQNLMANDSNQEHVETQETDAGLPLPAGRRAASVKARLRQAIESGIYGKGDQLPAERQLATAFGTARGTIRRILCELENEGLVERKVGSGTFVDYAGPDIGADGEIADLVSPLELIEARLAVEPHMTRLAALNATGRDLESLREVLDKLEACGNDKEVFTHWDSAFHLLLARSSHNPLLVSLYQRVNEVRSHAQWDAMKDKILLPEEIAAYNRQHRDLYEALCRRDVNQAVAVILDHLEKARHDLVGAHSG